MLHQTQAKAQRGAAIGSPFERAIPAAARHIDCAHLHAVRARIAHQLRRRIKTHRLTVDERRAKGRGLVMFEPGGGIDEQCKARRMRIVNNEVIGQEIVIAFDLQIVCFPTAGCLDLHNSVPINIGT